MKSPPRTSARMEHRLRERERVARSATLAEKFPRLKALTAALVYFDKNGQSKTGEMRYKVNLQHAKSVFSFVCPHGECVGGDFDLSEAVELAVKKRRGVAEGELHCPGTRKRANGNPVPCLSLLHYKLTLRYV